MDQSSRCINEHFLPIPQQGFNQPLNWGHDLIFSWNRNRTFSVDPIVIDIQLKGRNVMLHICKCCLPYHFGFAGNLKIVLFDETMRHGYSINRWTKLNKLSVHLYEYEPMFMVHLIPDWCRYCTRQPGLLSVYDGFESSHSLKLNLLNICVMYYS